MVIDFDISCQPLLFFYLLKLVRNLVIPLLFTFKVNIVNKIENINDVYKSKNLKRLN